jgi:hypothetical protein
VRVPITSFIEESGFDSLYDTFDEYLIEIESSNLTEVFEVGVNLTILGSEITTLDS